jgi:UDP-N-acetylmuramoyl-tripeptide--D-alanyl-D-alanine ligase
MSFWSPDNLQRVTNGRWLSSPPVKPITGVSIDTRTLQPGQAYLAIIGENHDGHAFIDKAFGQGASCAIVSRQMQLESKPILQTTDTAIALQQLASAYRDELAIGGCKVISISGSNGKTTTRHILHHVLTYCGLKGTQSPKSFNNHLGVPLTLLAAQPDHDFVCCEIGTNHPGEIAALAAIAQPDAAIITSIGEEHLEFLKDVQGVAYEEAAILPAVKGGGLVVTTAQAAGLISPWYDVQEGVALLPVKDDASVPPALPGVPGGHNRMNAALVLAMTRWLSCDDAKAKQALQTARTPEGRLRIMRYGEVTVIDDSYNANPDSMRAALDFLRICSGRKVAVLGDMLELGEASVRAHHAIGVYAASIHIDLVACIGPRINEWAFYHLIYREYLQKDSPKTLRFPDVDTAINTVIQFDGRRFVDLIQPGDVVLLKGSRGMRLERILPAIEARFGPPEV